MTTQAAISNAQPITPEQADAMLASEAAANENTVEAERPPVKAPETAIVPETIVATPHPELPKPPQAANEPTAVAEATVENLVILPAVAKKAEENLAAHLGKEVSPELEKGLILSVLDSPSQSKTNLVLSFEGEMVASNASLMGEQVIAALHKIPALQALIVENHQPTTRLHDGKLEVTIPHLTTAQYAHVIQGLAAGIDAKQEAPKEVAKEEAVAPAEAALPAGHQCDASCNHAALPKAEEAAAPQTAPANVVAGPVASQATIEKSAAASMAI